MPFEFASYVSDVREDEYPKAWRFGLEYYYKHLRISFLFWDIVIYECSEQRRRMREMREQRERRIRE